MLYKDTAVILKRHKYRLQKKTKKKHVIMKLYITIIPTKYKAQFRQGNVTKYNTKCTNIQRKIKTKLEIKKENNYKKPMLPVLKKSETKKPIQK